VLTNTKRKREREERKEDEQVNPREGRESTTLSSDPGLLEFQDKILLHQYRELLYHASLGCSKAKPQQVSIILTLLPSTQFQEPH
jgi:hypothetical protein